MLFRSVVGKSVFSGDINQNDIYIGNKATAGYEDNAYSVMTIKAKCMVEIRNCIISGGYADNPGVIGGRGGGINNNGPSLQLVQVELRDNYATNNGAGIYSVGNITASDCVFVNNRAENMGGGYYISSNLWRNQAVNTVFAENSANSGSAMYIAGLTEGYYSGNTFSDNRSKFYGTLAVVQSATQGNIVIINNTFANNILESSPSVNTPLCGGAAVNINTAAASNIYLVNNTITGNINQYDNANFFGAAVHISQGQLNLCNNIIAGNYSTSTAGGDVYVRAEGGKLLKSQYNIYTSAGNMNISAGSLDFLSANYVAGISALENLLDGKGENNRFVPNLRDNGGKTPTIIVRTPHKYNQQDINILGSQQLSELSLGIDLNGNGIIEGYMGYDQRGVTRSLSNNKSTIGAFEYDGSEPSSANELTENLSWNVYVNENKLHLQLSEDCRYELFDMNGSLKKTGYADMKTIDISFLQSGIYVIKVTTGYEIKTKRFIKN